MNVRLEITNLEEFKRDIASLAPNAEQGVIVALQSEAERIMDGSAMLVPVLTGMLRSSKMIGIPHRTSGGWEIVFGYTAPYALYQHYGNYQHDDGQRLFLATPTKLARHGLAERFATILMRFWRGVR